VLGGIRDSTGTLTESRKNGERDNPSQGLEQKVNRGQGGNSPLKGRECEKGPLSLKIILSLSGGEGIKRGTGESGKASHGQQNRGSGGDWRMFKRLWGTHITGEERESRIPEASYLRARKRRQTSGEGAASQFIRITRRGRHERKNLLFEWEEKGAAGTNEGARGMET